MWGVCAYSFLSRNSSDTAVERMCVSRVSCHFFTKLSSSELALPQLLSLGSSKGTSFKERKIEDESGHCKVCYLMVVWYYVVKAIKLQKFENKGKTVMT